MDDTGLPLVLHPVKIRGSDPTIRELRLRYPALTLVALILVKTRGYLRVPLGIGFLAREKKDTGPWHH